MQYTSPPNPQDYYEQVWHLVRQVPYGKVVTYGQIAQMIPPPEGLDPQEYKAFGSRWVGGAMAACPADVPWQPGEAAYFFKVIATAPEQYWFAEAAEAHLTAKLGVVAEPLTTVRQRFHVVTVLHYNKWTGVVYFNVIRPFHHLVVRSMMKAAVLPNNF